MICLLLKVLSIVATIGSSRGQSKPCSSSLKVPSQTSAFVLIENNGIYRYALGLDKDLVLIDRQNKIQKNFTGFHDNRITKLVQIGDFILASSQYNSVLYILNINSLVKTKFQSHTLPVRDISNFPSMSSSAASLDEKYLIIWNIVTLAVTKNIALKGKATSVAGLSSRGAAIISDGFLVSYAYDNDALTQTPFYYGTDRTFLTLVKELNMYLAGSYASPYVELLREGNFLLSSVAKFSPNTARFLGGLYVASKSLFFMISENETDIVKFDGVGGLTLNDTITSKSVFMNSFFYTSSDDSVYLLTDQRIVVYDVQTWPVLFYSEDCFKCPALCQTCDAKSEPLCLECSASKAYLFYGLCPQSCPLYSTNAVSSSKCECYPGYYPERTLGVQAQCSPCPVFCSNCSNSSYCLECQVGYRLALSSNASIRMCTSCPSNCNECQFNNKCVKCSNDFNLALDGSCSKSKSLISCKEGEFYNNYLQTCSDCDISCNTCYGQTNKDCYTCSDGWAFNNEKDTCLEKAPKAQENATNTIIAIVASCCCGFILLLIILYLIIKQVDRRSRRVTMLNGNNSDVGVRKSNPGLKTIPTAVAVIPSRTIIEGEADALLETKPSPNTRKIIFSTAADGEKVEERLVETGLRHIYFDPLQINIRPPAGIQISNDEQA